MLTWNSADGVDYTLFDGAAALGTVHTHRNEFHGRNCYLKAELTRYDFDPAPFFAALYAEKGRPLHTMAPHPNREMAEFLVRGGFALRRRCFLMKVTAADLSAPVREIPLEEYETGSPEYGEACRLLYAQYARDHAPISPLTADFDRFCSVLPARILCVKGADGGILHYAFPEENEIAYVGSEELSSFPAFAEGLLGRMFARYDTVEFEADDVDPVATSLRARFTTGDGFSLDTYTYDPNFET